MILSGEFGEPLRFALADIGPSELLSFDNGAVTVVGEFPTLNPLLAEQSDAWMVHWSGTRFDFDRDNLPDSFISAGRLLEDNHDSKSYVVASGGGGPPVLLREEIGLDAVVTGTDELPMTPKRATVMVDLERDGRPELVEFRFGQHPEILELRYEELQATTCTVLPVPRYARAYGYGFSLAAEDSDRFFTQQAQGLMHVGLTNRYLSNSPCGRIQFPSGYQSTFCCDDEEFVTVVREPEWLDLTWAEEAGRLDIDLSAFVPNPQSVSVAYRSPDGDGESGVRPAQPTEDDGEFSVTLPSGTGSIMLRVDDRWVGEWLTLSPTTTAVGPR
jgi:hypothetical protein